ncbi:Methyltransferase-like protein 5 [Orchesella cincta]|uniref:Methyltransferase-like protein 5 n=1 Tax=Orchesella cincta TaxID=48709 RepID=A0A1D2MLW2_ORCCI|nr:Methyltransferase-like protein 5 [Orchesella cincta]
MKLKELESWLTRCEGFKKPKVKLEQYVTSSHIAARMLYAAQENIEGSSVCDLGSGCGILSIGSVLLGAQYVCGIEIDLDAINIALENYDEFFDEDDEPAPLDFINAELTTSEGDNEDCCSRFNSTFDVVVMNPPFGTKNNAGIDYAFLQRALKLVHPGGHVYSLHKSSTRDFFMKKLKKSCEEFGCLVKGEVMAEVRYELPKTYRFHKEKSLDIAVDFWCFQKQLNTENN